MVPIPNFVLAPGVKCYIATEKHGIIDVSDDLVDGEMVRRSDGVSSFQFSLQNVRRKYDGVLTPNDRIAVQMKRLKWVQVYTGYLNKVPLVTAWPRVVHLTSSCSLKRLQYWYWDSHAEASQTMVRQALEDAAKESGVSDGGMTNVILTILKKVVGWPESKAHIAKIPGNWYGVIETLAKQIDAELDDADKIARTLLESLGTASVGTGGADASSLTGKYGGFDNAEQKKNAATIYSVGKQKGGSTRDCIIAIMTAMQESGLRNLDHGDRDSIGLFQQRPSQGWGTKAEIMNPEYSAGKFYEALFKVKNRNSMELWQVCQAVQRSGAPREYQKHEKPATAMVRDLEKGGGGDKGLKSKPQGTTSGLALAQLAVNYCDKYPNIPYTQKYGGTQMSILTANPPPGLDCSSFVQAMYLRAMGSLYSLPRVASAQYGFCKPVSVKTALNTPGALVFKGGSPGSIHHVEMSLGDGKNTIGAHRRGAKPHDVGVNPPLPASYWDYGGFLPRVAYTTGAGGVIFEGTDGVEGAASSTEPVVELVTGADAPGYNPDDPFDKMFGDNAWLPISTADNDPNYAMAQMLAGPRALLNDQPLLPYLKNLFNSTMRSFSSAPNGDLIAWYPDYYGMWGAAAKMVIEPIEVQDFEVSWSDDYMVTHQFVVTAPFGTNTFDPSTGTTQAITQDYLAQAAIFTTGVVSVDFPGVWKALFGMDMTEKEAKKYADSLKKRFGARPDYQQLPGLVGPKAQLFSAIFLFMRQFAYQYSASVPLTFMPELYPGMLIQIPAFNFQAYVTTVTHSFKFGPDGHFNTSVNIAAPARLTGDKKLLGLPMAGGQ
ncbi:C40 family peptidase [Streptomyces sp. NBC_01242]|uniref:C40 family peptidase n=1 Tax=Streptomyces sp. NBC_01242 TaxID=2903795 RepID=UPI002250BCFE|nr:NlpC/P60 family protein [Streptomyces sp. NBC_01242]MCX4799548.1 C40 family peptidase [Streptomyces sp. NBC_01242]